MSLTDLDILNLVSTGDLSAVACIVKEQPNRKRPSDLHLLIQACASDKLSIATWLIDNGNIIRNDILNVKDNPIYYCCLSGSINIMDLITSKYNITKEEMQAIVPKARKFALATKKYDAIRWISEFVAQQ